MVSPPDRMGGERPHRGDVRAGVALAPQLPGRGRRLGTPVAPRHRPQRRARVRTPKRGGDTCAPPARASDRPRRGGRVRGHRGTAFATRGARGSAPDTPGARARGARASRRGRAAVCRRRRPARRPARCCASTRFACAAATLRPALEGGHMSTLPPTLERFGAELESAARRDLGARRRRSWILRAAALSAIAAAIAFGVLSALPTGGPSVVQRAAAALQPPHDTILHYQLRAKQWNPDGTTVGWRSETWQLRVSPFTRRQLEVGSDGIRAESLTRGDLNELYDARRDTIYVATTPELAAVNMPRITIVSKSELLKLTKHPRVTAAYLVYEKGGKR